MWEITPVLDEARFAVRSLRRSPAFTVIAIVSLAVGLALTGVTLSVFNGYMVRSMPYPAADRLYHVTYAPQGQPEPRGMTALDWASLEDVVEIADNSAGVRFYLAGGSAQEASGLQVAFRAQEALGVSAQFGRTFAAADFTPQSEDVVLISEKLWRNRFGAAPDIVGRIFDASMNDQNEPPKPFRIVGILPPEFRDARNYARDPVDVVIPLRGPARTYAVRLREGVTPAHAAERITEAAKAVAQALPVSWAGVQLESVQDRYVQELRPVLISVLLAVGLLLVIVAANVSVLTVLRASRRKGELDLRLALGASRRQIFRLLIVENVFICGAAAGLSLAIAQPALRLLAPAIEEQLGRPIPGGAASVGFDPAALLAAGAIALALALFLPLIPTLTIGARRNPVISREGRGASRARMALIALEVAGSLALLVGCGLMSRSAINMLGADLGFQTAEVFRSRVALPLRNYSDAPAQARFYKEFERRLAADAGVQVALTNWPPFYEAPRQAFELRAGNSNAAETGVMAVSPNYFNLLRVSIKAGRAFNENDVIGAEPVAMVSETLATRLWPGGGGLGQQIRTAENPVARAPLTSWRTVVGIVRDVRQTYRDEDLGNIYIPFLQAPNQYAPLFIRSERPDSAATATVRRIAGEIDPTVLINEVTALQVEGDRLTAGPRFVAAVLSVVALVAVLLTVVGVYGVTAYAAQQREREVAIRIAVGAAPGAIVRMFLRQSAMIFVAGGIGGVVAATALARVLTSLLCGVNAVDANVLLGTGLLLGGVLLGAAWLPARQIAMQEPASALKEQRT